MRLTLEPGDDIAAVVRGATTESLVGSLVVVIPATLDALAAAQAKAAIAPLAVELAAATRVNAVVLVEDSCPADLDAAIAFLEQARSTTGQLIEVG